MVHHYPIGLKVCTGAHRLCISSKNNYYLMTAADKHCLGGVLNEGSSAVWQERLRTTPKTFSGAGGQQHARHTRQIRVTHREVPIRQMEGLSDPIAWCDPDAVDSQYKRLAFSPQALLGESR
nr:hypothetical protein GCM10017547_14300 [Pseudarthrobacter oxydans]